MKNKITVDELKGIGVHSDAGKWGFICLCPICKQKIRFAEHGWWDMTCECGYNWEIVLYAEGTK